MRDAWRNVWASRSLRLAFSMLMLTLSVLLAADFLEIRGNQRLALKETRKAAAESLAVQLSSLASRSDNAAISLSVSSFVERNPAVVAAALMSTDGSRLAEYGVLSQLERVSSASTVTHMSVPIFNKNRPWGEVRVVFAATRSMHREVGYFVFVLIVCFIVYVLFLRRALVQLNPSQVVPGRVNSAFNMFSEGVLILDDQLRILLANDAAAETVGVSTEKLIGQKLDDWPWLRAGNWQAPWSTALHSGIKLSDQPLKLQIDGEQTRVLMISCSLVGSEEDGKRGVLVTLDDMTAIEQKNRELAVTLRRLRRSQESITRKNRELEELATRDPLTGLANRRALMDNFEREFAKARRESTSLSCIMTDIDHFKRINDTYGHSVGDEVICAVANTLMAECREYDTVARYGGEEFVVVIPGLTEAESAEVAERIRREISILANNASIPVDHLTASVGLVFLESDVTAVLQLIEHADQALYAAKQGGRNRVIIFDPKVQKLETGVPGETVGPLQNEQHLSRVVELEAIVEQRTRDLEQLQEFDALTGIPRRTLFLQRVETEIQRAERLSTSVGVLSLEVKDLNRIVSSFGIEATDALVVDIVMRLHEGLRRTDVVSELTHEHSMSRITSNEYGVLLSDLDDSSQAMPVVTRLRRLLSKPFLIGDSKLYIGANIGIALYPQGGKTAAELLENACHVRNDAALKPEKVSHAFASVSLDKVSREYIQLETDLYDAFDNGDFEVYFQPKFDLDKRSVGGMEALIRWQHPERGFIPPPEFIAIAEANGLIHDLSAFVLEESLQQLNTWRAMGWDDLQVSVNISPMQLREPSIVTDILGAIEKAGVPARQIEVELTETSVIDSQHRARIVLSQLREAGLSVSMDDFGTGYTSLGLLVDLPLDTVKIDRSFVVAMTDSSRSRAVVESVINMSHALSLRVVGEGVETNEQLSILASLGCNEIQGYLISRPLPAAEITEFLRQQNTERIKRRA